MENALQLGVVIKGHVFIEDDLGNVLLDKDNAIHSQNMARVFARALSHEPNSFIHRIAYGNGGTIVDAADTITYKTPNDGQLPDTATWDSRIYNETYSEIVDAGLTVLNPLLGTDPGSADLNTGVRTGGGAVPADDDPTNLHVSGPGCRSRELGLISQVIIQSMINSAEPRGQSLTAGGTSTESDFVFDEIGLYTSGAQAIATNGYQNIDVGTRGSTDPTFLANGQTYSFNIAVDGGTSVTITFTTPASGGSGLSGEILYGDLCQAINTGDVSWGFTGSNPLPGGAIISITDETAGTFPTITGQQTYGFLRFESITTGPGSSVNLAGAATTNFIAALNPPAGGILQSPVNGTDAGAQNSPTMPNAERERLLTHIIFAPIAKSADRSLKITYTLTISVARSI